MRLTRWNGEGVFAIWTRRIAKSATYVILLVSAGFRKRLREPIDKSVRPNRNTPTRCMVWFSTTLCRFNPFATAHVLRKK